MFMESSLTVFVNAFIIETDLEEHRQCFFFFLGGISIVGSCWEDLRVSGEVSLSGKQFFKT